MYLQLLVLIVTESDLTPEDEQYIHETVSQLSKEYAVISKYVVQSTTVLVTEEPVDYIVTFTRVDGKLTHEIKPYESKTTQKSEGTV